MENKELYVELHAKVHELVRFGQWSDDRKVSIQKDLFYIYNCYYLYVYQVDIGSRIRDRSLKQLTRDEYLSERTRLMAMRPVKSAQSWREDNKNYELKVFVHYNWHKVVPDSGCHFFNKEKARAEGGIPNVLYRIYRRAVKLRESSDAPLELGIDKHKKAILKMVIDLSKELGIAFENVRAIGPYKEKLLVFKKSYKQAIENVKQMPFDEMYALYAELKTGGNIVNRKSVLSRLNIEYFGARESHLNISELEAVLLECVNKHQQEIVEKLIHQAVNLSFEEREEILNRLSSHNLPDKRKVLTDLGVNAQKIDCKLFGFAKIKHAVAASLGMPMV